MFHILLIRYNMEQKQCAICKEIKDLLNFGFIKSENRYKSYCKSCLSVKQSEYHKKNHAVRLIKMRAYNKSHQAINGPKQAKRLTERRRENKEKLITIMGGECVCCHYKGCKDAFDFHHLDESKKAFDLSKRLDAWEGLLEESKKCVLVCARCHREIHARFRTIP